MSPASNRKLGAALAAALIGAAPLCAQPPAAPAAASEQDQVADYLERMNLQPLLLEHLSTTMKGADTESRLKIAERLARHYASLLADAPDATRRAELVAHAESLLKLVPQARAYELRIGLLKTRYTAAEDQAERVRLRLATPEVKAEAIKNLGDVRTQFLALASDLSKKEESLVKTLDSGPADSDRLERDLADTRRWRSTAQYFAGWAGVYSATLEPNPTLAAESERAFNAILAAGDTPTPAKLEKTLLKYEHVARSVIGLAALRSLQGRDVDAVAWLDLLKDSPNTDPGARAVLLRWRITVLAAAGRWADLDRDVRRARSGADAPPDVFNLPKSATSGGGPPDVGSLEPANARLLAVAALESQAPATLSVARSLARLAVGDLIARRQLASVLDLARRYGADALMDEGGAGGGFIGRYVRGMQAFEAAVNNAKAAGLTLEEPATAPEMINAFNDAATQLAQAAAESDGAQFKVEQGVAVATSARALFMAGKLRESAERFSLAFEKARDGGDTAAAQDNLYMAIATLEKALKREPGKLDQIAIDERIEQLSTLFIKTYPSSERAVTLTLRSIARTDRTDEEAVRVLQSVNKDSPAYEAARRQLARLLYRLYRASVPADRPYASSRYLRIAEEVLVVDRKAALEAKGDAVAPAVERALGTGRQMLDAVLSTAPPDAAKAEQVMATIRQILFTTTVPAAQWADELDFRSVQIFLARGQLDKADSLADVIRSRMDAAKPGTDALTSARRFHTAARRVLLQQADNALRAAKDDASRAESARRVLANGLPLTDELVPNADSLRDGSSAVIVSRVAEAGAVLWRVAGDAPARDSALRLDRALIAARGPSIESLTRIAELSEAAGDVNAASEAWRSLASVAADDSPGWHRAKYELFRLLANSDRKTASAAVAQHLILHPTGPEPWQTKIKELAAQLGVDTSAPSAPSATPAPAKGGPK
jgi:hypothetical protein